MWEKIPGSLIIFVFQYGGAWEWGYRLHTRRGRIGIAVCSLTFSRGLERFMLVKVMSLFCWARGCSKKDSFVGGWNVREITATVTGQEREKEVNITPGEVCGVWFCKHALGFLFWHTQALYLFFFFWANTEIRTPILSFVLRVTRLLNRQLSLSPFLPHLSLFLLLLTFLLPCHPLCFPLLFHLCSKLRLQ